ncbi:MAG: hypothetical protein FWB76_07050 [Oscillospiraceae bacterium]|nr:hypothetical protein [Oscillospiraceae bacterium]
MKKLIALATALVLVLALAACAAPIEPVVAETTAEETTTGVYTTAELRDAEPVQGEAGGITWRTIDLREDETLRASLVEELERSWSWSRPEEQAHGYGVYTLNRIVNTDGLHDRHVWEVVHRNSAGRETVLLTSVCPYADDEEHCCFSCQLPSVAQVLNEDYMLVHWLAERHGSASVMCIRTQRNYPLANSDISSFRSRDGRLFGAPYGWYWPSSGTHYLFEADLSALPQLTWTNLLANIAHEPFGHGSGSVLCSDGRFYLSLRTGEWDMLPQLFIFDLQQQSLQQLQPPTNPSNHHWCWFNSILMTDDNTLHWFSHCMHEAVIDTSTAVRIELP